jgi:hypothetical protein
MLQQYLISDGLIYWAHAFTFFVEIQLLSLNLTKTIDPVFLVNQFLKRAVCMM